MAALEGSVTRLSGARIPVGVGFACLTVITGHTLLPGQSFSQVYTVRRGRSRFHQAIVLPPGMTAFMLVSKTRRFA